MRRDEKILPSQKLSCWFRIHTAIFILQYHKYSMEALNSFVSCFQNPNRPRNPVMEALLVHWKNQSRRDHFYVGAFSEKENQSILTILLTTASTSATIERENSWLRYIKMDFHNSMTEDRFNALILMYVHRDIKLDREKIIDRYAAKYPRRMLLQNPL